MTSSRLGYKWPPLITEWKLLGEGSWLIYHHKSRHLSLFLLLAGRGWAVRRQSGVREQKGESTSPDVSYFFLSPLRSPSLPPTSLHPTLHASHPPSLSPSPLPVSNTGANRSLGSKTSLKIDRLSSKRKVSFLPNKPWWIKSYSLGELLKLASQESFTKIVGLRF